jgi:hypothetical protein
MHHGKTGGKIRIRYDRTILGCVRKLVPWSCYRDGMVINNYTVQSYGTSDFSPEEAGTSAEVRVVTWNVHCIHQV